MRQRVLTSVFVLFLATSCGQPKKADGDMENKETYSLCPKTDTSVKELPSVIKHFANEEKASIVDRGADAQREISGISAGKGVLDATGGGLVMLTVDKRNEFRVSLSNLGLKRMVDMSVRYRKEDARKEVVDHLSRLLNAAWNIGKVEDGVTGKPQCG